MFKNADGQEIQRMANCSCCQVNTAGIHEWTCPCFASEWIPIPLETWPKYKVPEETSAGTHQYFCPTGYY